MLYYYYYRYYRTYNLLFDMNTVIAILQTVDVISLLMLQTTVNTVTGNSLTVTFKKFEKLQL